MSADLNTEITMRGTKNELFLLVKVLRMFETDYYEQYCSDRDCAYIETVELNNGDDTVDLEDMSDDEIREFIDSCDDVIDVAASGPWGVFGELGEVGLFEEMADAAPNASFEGHINGFITGADVSLDAELKNGKLTLSEMYLSDDMRPEYDEEDEDAYEEAVDALSDECTKTYTYDPATKEYEGKD